MNSVRYKDHTARVHFDKRGNAFVGRLLGMSSIINFHRKTVESANARLRIPAITWHMKPCHEGWLPLEFYPYRPRQ
jgi:predicted HicB family RNase H-like nuclease